MMNAIDNNNSQFVPNPVNFADQGLMSGFDNSAAGNNLGSNMMNNMTNSMNNSMNNNMNNMSNNMGNHMTMRASLGNPLGNQQDRNKLLLKHIRGRNTKDFKELVANFWMPGNGDSAQPLQTPSNQAVKNINNPLIRRPSSSDAFGSFHPIDISAKNGNMNGKPNATMDMRIPLDNPSMGPSSNNLGIDKNFFRPSTDVRQFFQKNNMNSNMGSSSNVMNNTMMPPLTQSLNGSMCNASVISDDSMHSVKPSPSAIINAATNIVNGNEFDALPMMNNMMNNNMNFDLMSRNHSHMNGVSGDNASNVVSEPGPYDIVCGRNSGAYNYIGNRRFRVTIEMNLQRYIDSPTREDKTNVIKSIVWMLHEQVGARFLKKETSKKSSGSGSRRRGTPRYTIMTDKQAREKVGHALRDLVITARKEQQQANSKKETQEQKAQKELLQQPC